MGPSFTVYLSMEVASMKDYKLVEVMPTDIHPGRVVTQVNADGSETSYPVYTRKGKRMAMVPAYAVAVFLAVFDWQPS